MYQVNPTIEAPAPAPAHHPLEAFVICCLIAIALAYILDKFIDWFWLERKRQRRR